MKPILSHLLKARTEAEYRRLFVEYNSTKDEKRISYLQDLDENAQHYCFWPKQKQTFLGRFAVKNGDKFQRNLVDTINIKRSYSFMLTKILNSFIYQRSIYEAKCETIIDNLTI